MTGSRGAAVAGADGEAVAEEEERVVMRFPGLRALCTFGVLFCLVNGNGPATAAEAEAAGGDPLTILALGDSLMAGYDLPQGDAFPVRLEEALRTRGYDVSVINAGVSGDTTAGGRARLDWLIGGDPPDAAIVELGANDALRGLPPEEAEKNLAAIIDSLQEKDVAVLLAGMMAPRNMGPDYVRDFDAMYPRLAETHGVLLYPFFMEGVALNEDLLLPDGMHPTAEGVGVMVENILPAVEKLIDRARAPGE